jgi:alpha-methylacyl-CoA racemase
MAEWRELLEGTDVCFAPVLTLDEAFEHPHNVARNTFVRVGGNVQAAPAPRFSETPGDVPRPGVAPGTDSRELLVSLGYSGDEVDALIDAGVVQIAG